VLIRFVGQFKSILCLRGLDEVHLQEALEVEVGHLILVADTEELGERGVGEDATLERGVKARVGLDILADELGHLGLRAGLTGLESHEGAELLRERALDEEGVVGATGLPDRLLLGGHCGRVLTLLLLGVTGLTLGRLRRLLNSLHGVADTDRELRAERLERLSESGELDLRRDSRNRRSLNSRGGNSGHRHLSLRGRGGLDGLGLGLSLHLGLNSLGGSRLRGGGGNNNGGRGGNGLGGGILLGGRHLV
jgi:hypothetical protein